MCYFYSENDSFLKVMLFSFVMLLHVTQIASKKEMKEEKWKSSIKAMESEIIEQRMITIFCLIEELFYFLSQIFIWI